MAINTQLQEIAAYVTYGSINHSIRSLELEGLPQQTAVADTLESQLQRLVRVYAGVKPLLAVIATMPLLPHYWRVALALFAGTLDAVAASTERHGSAEVES
jgi:hypothetical protein